MQYQNGQLALLITGERGAKFDWDKHKWSPTEPMEEGIVSTESGNDYYLFTDYKRTYVINTRESIRSGKLVAAYKEFPAQLPSVEFRKPWKIPGFYTTSDVKSILLKYKIASNDYPGVDRKIDGPNPFDKYQSLLRKPGR